MATNPFATWSERRFRIAFWILLIALIATAVVMKISDRALETSVYTKSQELEWVSSPPCAQCVVEEWQRDNGRYVWPVTRGILLDTFAFIPCYSTLIAVCCFWLAKHLADEQLKRAAVLLGWGGWVAGAFDLLENGGQLIEVYGRRYGLAPLTAGFADVKWTIGTIAGIFIVAIFLRRRSLFAAVDK